MNIKKYLNIRKVSPFDLVAIGFIAGIIVVYLYFQPKIMYQGKTAQQWADLAATNQKAADQNQRQALNWAQMYATTSAQLKNLQNQPAPAPQVIYKTQTSATRDLSSCNKQGNFYFCPDDNRTYNPNGTWTGVTQLPPGI